MIEIRMIDVGKSYLQSNNENKNVLSKFNIALNQNEITTIIGPNGCGKSTVLNLFAGLIKPDEGSITMDGKNSKTPKIGYIWQDYRASLLPWYNIGENIGYPLRIQGVSKKERREKVLKLLQSFNNQIQYNDKTYALSGGQQQLVNLLRCFSIKPDLLLFDEPFSALDQANQWKMVFTLENIWLENKTPILIVSHDIDEAIMLADRIILMSNANGNIKDIIHNELPRPRNVEMLNSNEHIKLRKKIIDYILK